MPQLPPGYGVIGDERRVDAFSPRALPFEPRGSMRGFRDELQTAIRALRPNAGEALIATYSCPIGTVNDLENVLLYNVGSGCYSRLLTKGVVLRRRLGSEQLHRMTYELNSIQDPDSTARHIIASFAVEVPEPPLLPRTPLDWWRLVRSRVLPTNQSWDGPLVIDVRLIGEWRATLVAAVVKPFIDGLVSALHAHEGTPDPVIVERLGGSSAWAALCDSRRAPLGSRSLVRRTPTGLAWNPADDRIDGLRIETEPGATRSAVVVVRCRLDEPPG